MAPVKQGLDYFRYRMGLLKDRKLRKAKMKYGPAAPVVYLALLELIYSDKGYYLKYDDDVIWNVMEYLQGAYCPSAETVRGIVEDLVACELFSGDHFRNKILTSKRVQAEYYNATVDRKAVSVDFSVWLLSESEMKAISGKSVILRNFQNRPICGDNRPNSEDNQPDKKQSRVEKSTVEKSTVEYRKPGRSDEQTKALFRDVEALIGSLNPSAGEELKRFLKAGAAEDLIRWAAGQASGKEQPWPYLRAVLKKKLQEGVRTTDDLPSYRKKAAGGHRSYDLEEFEKRGFQIPALPKGEENDSGN